MIEPTEEVGLCGGNPGEGSDLEVAQIKHQQGVRPGKLHDGIHVLVVGDIPGKEGEVIKCVTLVVPHHLQLCAGARPTTTGARKLSCETLGEPKARTIGNIHVAKRGKECLVTD